MRLTRYQGQERKINVDLLQKLKSHAGAIIVLAVSIAFLIQFVSSRREISDLNTAKKQLMADLSSTREKQLAAAAELDKLKEGLHAIGAGLDTGQTLTAGSTDLVGKLKKLVSSIPTNCRCYDIKP